MTTWKILLIDDEEDFVTTLAERLQLRGLQAKTATDGETGLSLMESEPFHVVILDIMMPGMGGLEVLQRIKEFNPLIPAILLTGHGTTETTVKGMKMGAFDYLIKPFDIEELIKKIDEATYSK